MKRVFIKDLIRINRDLYEPVGDYDTSILKNISVKIIDRVGGQRKYAYIPTNNEKRLLGTKAKFIILRRTK